jgi:hypothetical protein
MIYLLTANGLTPGGSSTVHIYTQTAHRKTQSTQTIHGTTQLIGKSAGRAPSLQILMLYPRICLTTEEKARKNLSQGRRRMPVGTIKREYTEQSIHNNNNT